MQKSVNHSMQQCYGIRDDDRSNLENTACICLKGCSFQCYTDTPEEVEAVLKRECKL
jgi:hypothetical protein